MTLVKIQGRFYAYEPLKFGQLEGIFRAVRSMNECYDKMLEAQRLKAPDANRLWLNYNSMLHEEMCLTRLTLKHCLHLSDVEIDKMELDDARDLFWQVIALSQKSQRFEKQEPVDRPQDFDPATGRES